MLIHYTINYAIYTELSLEGGEADSTGEEMSDTGNLTDVLRTVVRLYGIVAHGEHDVGTWWGTNHPVEDRAYFERGEQKYFTFHITSPVITDRNRTRINNMLRALW